MKNNLFKLYILSFFLLSDYVLFAQPGDDTIDPGDLEGDDPAPVPINSKLILLVIVGIAFAVYKFNKNKKIA